MAEGGFINKRTGKWVSDTRAHQHVGETIDGYTKARSSSTGNYYMRPSGGLDMLDLYTGALKAQLEEQAMQMYTTVLNDAVSSLRRSVFNQLSGHSGVPEKMEELAEAKKQADYEAACELLSKGNFKKAQELFLGLGEWKDAPAKAEVAAAKLCQWQYKKAAKLRSRYDFDGAISLYKQLGDYRDAGVQLQKTLEEKEEDRVWREREEELRKDAQIKKAEECIDSEQFQDAEEILKQLGDYKTAPALLDRTHALEVKEKEYRAAKKLADSGSYKEAGKAFESLGDYKSSVEHAASAHNNYMSQCAADYNKAERLFQEGSFAEAACLFGKLADYRDSIAKKKEAEHRASLLRQYEMALVKFRNRDYKSACEIAKSIKHTDVDKINLLAAELCKASERTMELEKANADLKTQIASSERKIQACRNHIKYTDKRRQAKIKSEALHDETMMKIYQTRKLLELQGFFAIKEKRRLRGVLAELQSEQEELEKKAMRERAQKEPDIDALVKKLKSTIEEEVALRDSAKDMLTRNEKELTAIKQSY